MFAAELYRRLDGWALWPLAWVALCALWTAGKTALRIAGREVDFREHLLLTELPGLPLMLLHSVGFGLAFWLRDWASAAVFAWWGPGYLLVASQVLTRGAKLRWQPWALATSWGCKLSYGVLVGLFAWHGCWTLPFAFSVWIMNDQVRLAWFRANADRTRRTCEDVWLLRLLYPGLLLLPWVVPVPGGAWSGVLGLLLLGLWAGGLAQVVRSGNFWNQPDPVASGNLRDIVYLARAREAPAGAGATG